MWEGEQYRLWGQSMRGVAEKEREVLILKMFLAQNVPF